MAHPDPGSITAALILVIVMTSGVIIALGVTWLQNRAKIKAIEVLKDYAQKGQEPPAGVIEAINKISWPFPPPPAPHRASAGEHLTHVAGSVVLSIGAFGIAWWRSQLGDTGAWMIIALIVGIFFAGSAAARLVAALTTRDGR